MNISSIGIDLAKSVFQLHGVDQRGKAVLRKKLSRAQVLPFLSNLPKCIVGMEACGGSNYWAREIEKLGHEVRLIPAQFVKPFVKSNKNDAADAEAICEAMSRPSMRFVAIKSVEQQDIQSLHRIRSRLIKSRTALSNEIRGLLHENGIVFPQSVGRLRKELIRILAEGETLMLTSLFLGLLSGLQEELGQLDGRIDQLDAQIARIHKSHPMTQLLAEIPGIGPLTATALVAASRPQAFKNGRQYSAWLGLVPRQHSSGGKDKLLGISKRGDVYLRMLLIQGAMSVLRTIENKEDRRSQWIKKLIERRGTNRAAVAYANKNARTAWAMLSTGQHYRLQTA